MTVSAQYAAQHIADLLDAASIGEEVEITMPANQSPLKLVAVRQETVRSKNVPLVGSDGRRILGAGRGELRVPSEEEWAEYKKEWPSAPP